MVNSNFQLKSFSINAVYIEGLLNEYDTILLGNKEKYSSMYFSFSDSVNEFMALTVFKYAIEQYLKWTPVQAYNMLSKEIVQQLKLNPLIKYIKSFPAELNRKTDLWYIVHKIYPHIITLNKRNLVNILMSRLISGKMSKFPVDYFFCEEGELRLCICLQYILEQFLIFRDIESMYEFFSNTELADKTLDKYNLKKAYKLYYETPLEYLHNALPAHQRNDFFYNYFSFKHLIQAANEKH